METNNQTPEVRPSELEQELDRQAQQKAAERTAYIQGLRDLANFLESRPDAPIAVYHTVQCPTGDKESFAAAVRAIGGGDKNFYDAYVGVYKNFGPIHYEVFIEREKVCVKRVIGTRTEPAKEVEVVEWECSDSILG